MQPRVTVVLVARTGAEFLPRTLAALAAQTHRPDAVIAVDAGSTDDCSALLAASGPTQLVEVPGKVGFSAAVSRALRIAAPHLAATSTTTSGSGCSPRTTPRNRPRWPNCSPPSKSPPPWRRRPQAHALGTARRAGRLRPDPAARSAPPCTSSRANSIRPSTTAAPTCSASPPPGCWCAARCGTRSADSTPACGAVDAGLDFCLRVRLAGHRVILVPGARVASAQGPESFGAPAAASPTPAAGAWSAPRNCTAAWSTRRWGRSVFHWLSLVPLAVLRSIGHLLTKRPGAIPGEFRAAFVRRVRRRTSPAPGATSAAPNGWAGPRSTRSGCPGPSCANAAPRSARPSDTSSGTASAATTGQASSPTADSGSRSPGSSSAWSPSARCCRRRRGHRRRTGPAQQPRRRPVGQRGLRLAGRGRRLRRRRRPVRRVARAARHARVLGALVRGRPVLRRRPAAGRHRRLVLRQAVQQPQLAARRRRPALDARAAVPRRTHHRPPRRRPSPTCCCPGSCWRWSTPRIPGPAPPPPRCCSPRSPHPPRRWCRALLLLWLLWLVAQPKSVHRLIGIPIPAFALFAPLIVAQLAARQPVRPARRSRGAVRGHRRRPAGDSPSRTPAPACTAGSTCSTGWRCPARPRRCSWRCCCCRSACSRCWPCSCPARGAPSRR